MNKKNVFEYSSYKSYLVQRLGGTGSRNGLRKKAASHMGCQTTYLSKVLNEAAHLSLEQAYLMNEFLGHNNEECDFFILLVQKGRSGSRKLSDYFELKIQEQIKHRTSIRNRLKLSDSLTSEDQTIYYSKWYYACIHVLVSIPQLNTKSSIMEHLKLPSSVITEALDFLETRGLLIKHNERYEIGPRHLHLAQESPHINKHHTNWRNKALSSLDIPQKNDLHYSVVVTLSQDDLVKIRSRILDLIQENMQIIKDSKEECSVAICMDYFQI